VRRSHHRQLIGLPLNPGECGLVELGIAQGLVQRMMAQQLFEDFQGDPRVEEVRGKRMPIIPCTE
jgi:hypothetical protein